MLTWLRGLAQLRHASLVRYLGERRFHLDLIASIRSRHPRVKLDSDVILISYQPELLSIDRGATISAGVVLAFGDDRNGHGKISIGTETWIGQFNNLRAGGGDIVVGSGCLISQFCTLVATNHQTVRSTLIRDQGAAPDRKGIILGDDVWLGAGVVVLPGVSIGSGAVIGANAVVNRDVPPFEIWAGVPAHRVGERT